jgi:bifunctional non-homologous end joining protein LigD
LKSAACGIVSKLASSRLSNFKTFELLMGLAEYRKKRDFRRTPEPKGTPQQRHEGPIFVVQKHAARRMHYDFRLEHDGVLKSWAVPKGPSLNPQEKRLAVEVEDHPLEYATFEGTIPEGEYGGGTVLVWDRGRWISDSDVAQALKKGHLHFRLEGTKLRGGWNLVRMPRSDGDKPVWLLIKSRDEEARRSEEADIVGKHPDSVASGRTLDEIAQAADRVWHSNRGPQGKATTESTSVPVDSGAPIGRSTKAPPRGVPAVVQLPQWREPPENVRPMLATLAEAPPSDPELIYEPKYDGIRALVDIEPAARTTGTATVRIWSRLGNEKTDHFPEIVRVLKTFGRKLKAGVLLDGEIVALDASGKPVGFQHLQGRVHLSGVQEDDMRVGARDSVGFMVFDILRDGDSDLRPLPLVARRARLERVMRNIGSPLVRLSDFRPHDGTRLYRQALQEGWEGLIAKKADSPYRSGKRTSDWRKIKILWRQECVIGGWTEPRQSRMHFGALLLGVYERDGLYYVGHTGTGFTDAELGRLSKLMRKLARPTSPFIKPPKTNERPHWVEPRLVAELKFTEWTADGKLRHPVYLGLRDDVDPRKVHREPSPTLHRDALRGAASSQPSLVIRHSEGKSKAREPSSRTQMPQHAGQVSEPYRLSKALEKLVEDLRTLEDGRGGGRLTLPNGDRLEVGHLNKIFWPDHGITKGELLRYYVEVSPLLLPVVEDRPLVMRRFPNGIKGKAFYQQRAPAKVPPGVRVETVRGDEEVPSRLIGGSLTTLLYMTQLAVISQDPWFSRVQSADIADYVALDLDPMPGVPWSQVLDVARWSRDELERVGVPSFPKTSGASGLHIYIPLMPGTPYEPGRIFCQMIATLVAHKHPDIATVQRSVHRRGRTIYMDYLQNIQGKTIATAYSARASEFAGVSMPVTWEEVDDGIRAQDFTIRTALTRLRSVGDLWAAFRQSPGVDLHAVLKTARVRGRVPVPMGA